MPKCALTFVFLMCVVLFPARTTAQLSGLRVPGKPNNLFVGAGHRAGSPDLRLGYAIDLPDDDVELPSIFFVELALTLDEGLPGYRFDRTRLRAGARVEFFRYGPFAAPAEFSGLVTLELGARDRIVLGTELALLPGIYVRDAAFSAEFTLRSTWITYIFSDRSTQPLRGLNALSSQQLGLGVRGAVRIARAWHLVARAGALDLEHGRAAISAYIDASASVRF